MEIITKLFQYPETYFERVCRNFDLSNNFGLECNDWFDIAIEHCSVQIGEKSIWDRIKNYIYPENTTDIDEDTFFYPVHFNPHLTVKQCRAFFLSIAKDSIALSQYNEALHNRNWLVTSVCQLTFLVILLTFVFIFMDEKLFSRVQKRQDLTKFRGQYRRTYTKLQTAKHLIEKFRIRHIVEPEDLISPTGEIMPILPMESGVIFLDEVVDYEIKNNKQDSEQIEELSPDEKTNDHLHALLKAIEFLESSGLIKLLVLMDENPESEELDKPPPSPRPTRLLSPYKFDPSDWSKPPKRLTQKFRRMIRRAYAQRNSLPSTKRKGKHTLSQSQYQHSKEKSYDKQQQNKHAPTLRKNRKLKYRRAFSMIYIRKSLIRRWRRSMIESEKLFNSPSLSLSLSQSQSPPPSSSSSHSPSLSMFSLPSESALLSSAQQPSTSEDLDENEWIPWTPWTHPVRRTLTSLSFVQHQTGTIIRRTLTSVSMTTSFNCMLEEENSE